MKKLMISAAVAAAMVFGTSAFAQEKVRLTGSGASFPAPLYLAWFKSLGKSNETLTVDYQSKGSGAGVKDFLNKTVDFAASDSAMKPEEMAKVAEGVQLLPMTAGEVVLAYNLPGIASGLKLSREIYAGIFLGKIKNWNDPKIAAANPGMKFPDLPITVVVRADSSGTTYVFTQHMSSINADFSRSIGTGNTVNWPTGDKLIKSPKNDGVSATIKQTPGAIGYLEYGFAKLSKETFASLQNKDGKFIAPGNSSETLAKIKLPADMIAWEPDPTGAKSYPIVSYTWMIFRKNNGDAAKAKAMRDMVEYGLTEGQKMSEAMGYIPLPANVVAQVRKAAANIK